MGYGPIAHFTDIEAWKLARKLRISVYSVILIFDSKIFTFV